MKQLVELSMDPAAPRGRTRTGKHRLQEDGGEFAKGNSVPVVFLPRLEPGNPGLS